MFTVLRRLVITLLMLFVVAYLSLVALSLPYQPENTEYPEWEGYVDYWNNEWVRIVNRAYSKDNYLVKYPADGDHVCVQTSYYKRFGFIPISTRMCFGNQTRWIRYIWHIPVAYKRQWTHPKKWYADFPHGPYTIHKPRPPRPKQVYARPITDEEIVNWFLQLATENEKDNYKHGLLSGDEGKFINKLTSSANIMVNDFTHGELFDGKTVGQYVDEFIIKLNQISGISLKRIERSNDHEHITIAFLYKKQRPELLKHIEKSRETKKPPNTYTTLSLEIGIAKEDANCLVMTYSEYGAIKFSYLVIYLDKKHPETCVHEELSQAIGINNDVREINPTIFNDYSPQPRLTKLDEVFLRILYTPEIKPYLSADEVRPIVEAIVKRYRQEGQLEGLQRRVYRP